ncbi:MAG: hypothetical protein CME25_03220 [Gemmatimonadetes bacterium]|nr:hypothetical protein [Gemmatimonadota bacterium]|tara:strand:+ start:1229 stop:1573 length:345 start_codon:yes stop_codon:yes gene_type:complete
MHLPSKEPYLHAVLEVRLDSSSVVLDPLYNIVFRKNNAFASLEDLKAFPELEVKQVPANYPLDLFEYKQYRKIRWTKFPFGEQVYNFPVFILPKNRVDGWAYPFFFSALTLCSR